MTYAVEYGFVDYLGQSLLWSWRDPWARAFGALVSRHATIANGPLFLAYAVLFTVGLRELRSPPETAGPAAARDA